MADSTSPAAGRTFAGTSYTNSLSDALAQAVALAQADLGQDAFSWRLAELTGMHGGFVSPDQVTVTIEVAEPGLRAEAAPEVGALPQVPTVLSGLVTRLEPISICMDGADFLLTTRLGGLLLKTRLTTSNDEARKVLAEYADTRQSVTVTGYLRTGVENCSHLAVYYAEPSADASPRQ